jgi:pyruvate-formate lyase
MQMAESLSRRLFLGALGAGAAAPLFAGISTPSNPSIGDLRRGILESPVGVALHRAKVFTRVFREHEGEPWIACKGLALREYLRSVPLYIRPEDRIAGSISETPGAMPVFAEIGIAENNIYTGENPNRAGYLRGQVPAEIREYWMNRSLWGQARTAILGQQPFRSVDEVPRETGYKFICNQGHLSPSYTEVLRVGLGGIIRKVGERKQAERDPEKLAFLTAAENAAYGVSEWAVRYSRFLAGEAANARGARAGELREMSHIAAKVATEPPGTFREALQLIWFLHQAIHIEGQGYSCTPDHTDQILYPFYAADRKAGRITDAEVLSLCENFVLKMYDNTVWGPEHHLTQGLCCGGSTADGTDLTNRLSWLFMEGATNLGLPEPLIWMRWHPHIDQEFFEFCLTRIARSTCFPLMWNDKAVPAGLMGLGVSREDAYNYIPVGCNELGIPGQFYFNPGANADYLRSIESALTSGRGYAGRKKSTPLAKPTEELNTFEDFSAAVGAYLRSSIGQSYQNDMKDLAAQMRWGQTPFTSCFFDGCVEKGHDLTQGTKYNILSCNGIFFANAVDSLAAIREVVYRKHEATLTEVAAACAANFKGYERLHAKLLAAPKHGNDDPRLDDLILLVERLRDEPMKEICHDPRDGTKFGNTHVVRSSAVRSGHNTPATPDGRLAGTPLASSVAASVGVERAGPTALLNSVCKLHGPTSWQTGYQVNIRFQAGMITNKVNRQKLRAMLNVYFQNGGQELQVNAVDTDMLRAAQKHPELYRDLVVRIAGFSEFFVNLSPDMQEDIIAREAYI